MNHKRKKPRQQRSGCRMCKWFKLNAFKDGWPAKRMAERRAVVSEREQRREAA